LHDFNLCGTLYSNRSKRPAWRGALCAFEKMFAHIIGWHVSNFQIRLLDIRKINHDLKTERASNKTLPIDSLRPSQCLRELCR
jgi:hypothetical protein